MAITTLKSPGVEITERDISQYTTNIAGTAVLVTGFASKGRDYEPIYLTSRSAWLQQFGEPTNEAERYFFNACMEVINQSGELYACKLPYKNDSLNQFVGKTYTVNVQQLHHLSTVADYVEDNHLSKILAGDYSDFGLSVDNDLLDAFYNAQLAAEQFKIFTKTLRNSAIAIPYAYALDDWMNQINIENCEKDNWMWTPVQFIYDKLTATFNAESKFRTALANLKNTEDWRGTEEKAPLSSFFVKQSTGEEIPLSINFEGTFDTSKGSIECANAFVSSLVEGLGGDPNSIEFKTACDPTQNVNINNVLNSFPQFADSATYRFFKNNEDLFNALNMIDFEQDRNLFGGQKPYFYCDDEKFNLGSYYRAVKAYDKVKDAIEVFNSFDVVKPTNMVIDLDKCLNEKVPELSISKLFDRFIESILPPSADYFLSSDNDELKENLIETGSTDLIAPIGLVNDAFKKLFESDEYKRALEESKKDYYKPTEFAKTAIEYYIDNTIIPNDSIKEQLRAANDLNVFFEKFDADGYDTTSSDIGTVFELFNGPESSSPELSSIPAVVDATIAQMRYDDFLNYALDFTSKEVFQELSEIAERGDSQIQKKIVNSLLSANIVSSLAYSEIKRVDNTVSEYLTIDSRSDVRTFDLETIDGYATGETPVRPNTFTIVDKTRATLGTAFAKSQNGNQKQIVGIIPVVTTAANGLYAQALLETGDTGIIKYNALSSVTTLVYNKIESSEGVHFFTIDDADAAVPFMSNNAGDYTVSQMAAASFPSIGFTSDGTMDRENLKKIGIVVLRAFLDPGEGNKVNYDIVEAYVGELDKNAVDPITGASTFLDTLINNQSEYIEFYSNCFNQTASRDLYSKMDLFIIPPQKAGSLGFYSEMTKKNISLTDSILKALPLVWEKNEDINEKQIDIVCDAGVSNIAQYIKSVFNGRAGEYDPASEYATLFKLRSKEDTKTWRAVLDMYDNFCKNIRKDCMFVADGPRPFCLQGNKKIVRPSKPSNTIDGNILPMLKYITGVNTNYGAGYCDWFQKMDEFSGDYFWCPPSIQAMGVYLNTDINFDFWMAPAGLNRGVVNVADVAFNPTMRQSNEIYPKCWNYARSYPNDGIVIEGQRTFQTRQTALDRVNVRRAMLRFERMTFEIARWFVYENNTVVTRQRLFDALDGVFKDIKGQGGIIDYKIICDETINTPEVIDRSELRVKIGIKPIKSAEFILIEFNVLRQGGSWTEML